MKRRAIAAAVLVCAAVFIFAGALLAPGCSSGLSKPPGAGAKAVPNENGALGFDPGFALTSPLLDRAVAAALIPAAAGGDPVELIFVAFSTATPADDGDGTGVALVRDLPAPADTNAASDVFLALLVNTAAGGTQGVAFNQFLVNAFRHPRCMNCHGLHAPVNPTVPGHPGGHPGNNSGCGAGDCHTDGNTGVPGIVWEAPFGLDFRNKTVEELCAMAQDFPAGATSAAEHLKFDDKIFWALEVAKVPFNGFVAAGGDVPFTQAQWNAQVDAWVGAGFPCNSAGAVRDIALASRATGGTSTGGGDSREPSLAYVPNPGFNPANPAATNPAGHLFIAYSSTSTNLILGMGAPANRNIFRARMAVNADQDATGAAMPGEFNLVLLSAETILVSPSTVSGQVGSNGDSARPSISGDGGRIAYESAATNLFDAAIVNQNGAGADVFTWRPGGSGIKLVSRQAGSDNTGGNGGSFRARISPGGEAVAFESEATDLIGADDNGVRDVFFARLASNASPLPVERASAATGGGEATGGPSRNATIAVDADTGAVLVAFQSEKRDLVSVPGSLPETNIYLHIEGGAGTTVLVSRRDGPFGTELPNGVSRVPSFDASGRGLYFESEASNLDALRTVDANGTTDVLRVDVEELLATGKAAPARISIGIDGSEANGPTSAPIATGLRCPTGGFDRHSIVLCSTSATNTGASDNSDQIAIILARDEDACANPVVPPNLAPICQIQVDQTAVTGETLTFDGSGSAAQVPGATIVSYQWNFGDGSSAEGPIVSHEYSSASNFLVTLIVTDSGGLLSNCSLTVTVSLPPDFGVVFDIFEDGNQCRNCHSPGNGVNFTTEATAYDSLVNIAATFCAGFTRVIPGDADNSYLILQIIDDPDACDPMPPSLNLLSDDEIETIKAWINSGAAR